MAVSPVRVALYVKAEPWLAQWRFKELRVHAQAQPGWQVVAEFCDSHVGRRRPGMRNALKAARMDVFDFLLVGPLEKVTRDARELTSIISQLDAAHVAFRSAAQPFDAIDPRAWMMLALLDMLSTWELGAHHQARHAGRRQRLFVRKGQDR